MTQEKKHSKLPWVCKPGEFVHFLPEQFYDVVGFFPDEDGDVELITSNRTTLENAQCIVPACNSFYPLLEALKRINALLTIDRIPAEPVSDYDYLMQDSLAEAQKAINIADSVK